MLTSVEKTRSFGNSKRV